MWQTHSCNRERFLTGISFSQRKSIRLSNVVGKLSFIDTPKIYDRGSNVEGKVSACGLHFFSVILHAVKMKQRGF